MFNQDNLSSSQARGTSQKRIKLLFITLVFFFSLIFTIELTQAGINLVNEKNKKELDFILQEGEGLKIEFKESLKNIDRELVGSAKSGYWRILNKK